MIVHEQPAAVFIQQVETTIQSLSPALVNARVVLAGAGFTTVTTVSLAFAYDDAPMSAFAEYAVHDGVALLTGLKVPNATLWSLEQPNLHTLAVTMAGPAQLPQDQIVVRLGLRLLGTRDGRLTLNGKVVKLTGYNRHTMYPDTGSALTLSQV